MASVGNGQFEFINNSDRIMFVTAHAAISQLELWDFMKKDTGSYMFSSDSEVRTIYAKIEELGYTGHSGGSFGCMLRVMQSIAQNGYDKFREDYLTIS
jgi:tRNA splicing endonuclease